MQGVRDCPTTRGTLRGEEEGGETGVETDVGAEPEETAGNDSSKEEKGETRAGLP